jgi:hypothetical protein
MARIIQSEKRIIVRTLADWVSGVLSNVNPTPSTNDIADISIGDSSIVTTLNPDTPAGNITSTFCYAITHQEVIDNLLVTDDGGLVIDDIEGVDFDPSGSGTLTFTVKSIDTEIGS